MHETPPASAPPGTFVLPAQHALSPGQRRAALVAVGLLALAVLWTLRAFLPALGWGAILAISLWPWYRRLCARWPGQARLVLPGAVTFLIMLAFVLPLGMVVAAIAREGASMMQWGAQVRAEGLPPPAFLHQLPMGDHIASWWQSELSQTGMIGKLSHGSGSALPIASGGRVLKGVAHALLIVVFMLLTLFFALRDGERAAQGLAMGSRRAFGPTGENVGAQMVQAIRGTVNGLVIVGLGEGVILGVAYGVAGVPHPALLGLLTALLSAVPLGSVLAYVLAAGLVAAGGGIGPAVALLVLGSVVVFVADHFVRPALIGGATRLPFLWVLLGILGGIEAWGLIGLVLGPALMAALMLLWREWIGAVPGPLNPPLNPALNPPPQVAALVPRPKPRRAKAAD